MKKHIYDKKQNMHGTTNNTAYMEQNTRGTEHTWNGTHVERNTRGTEHTWNETHMEQNTHGTEHIWNGTHKEQALRRCNIVPFISYNKLVLYHTVNQRKGGSALGQVL